MKELKILAVLVFFTTVTYWGVEPYAHHVFHPEVAPADFKFKDLKNVDTSLKGNATNGATLVQSNCVACHGLKSQGMSAPMDDASSAAAYGVVPPDLSSAGKLYETNFLANFIKDPAVATKTTHKFGDTKPHPMPGYGWMSDQDIMDMVAYFHSIAPKTMSNKEVFEDGCVRCHDMRYANINALTPAENIKSYMGSVPPDLSQMIRSRSGHFLETFINDPQKNLPGTAMPRVGLTEEAQTQVVTYLEEVGDSKKQEREALAPWVLGYLVIFTIFAYLWKQRQWREVH
jgi:ubiquinol-cytochrome c reductase cytochrome c1 subunit